MGEEGWKMNVLLDIHEQNKATSQFCNSWWLEKRRTRADSSDFAGIHLVTCILVRMLMQGTGFVGRLCSKHDLSRP